MRWSHVTALGLLTGACLAGCAAIAGIGDGERVIVDEGGALPDRVTPGEGGPGSGTEGGAGCPPPGNAEEGPGRLRARRVVTPVVIDGTAAEWACVDRLAFTGGQQVVGLSAGRGVADVAMQWDEQYLYFLATVKTGSAGGAAPGGAEPRDRSFANDSIHLFVAAPAPTAAYTAADHQIVLDWKDQAADFGITFRASLAGITSKMTRAPDEGGLLVFVVEARVAATLMDRPSFARDDVVRVNFQINDGPDSANNHRIWFRDAARCPAFAGCDKSGGSAPSCDPRCTGDLVLRD